MNNNFRSRYHRMIDDDAKAKLKKLFKEVVDDWLLKTNYFYEVSSMDPHASEQKAMEKYRSWNRQLADIIEKAV